MHFFSRLGCVCAVAVCAAGLSIFVVQGLRAQPPIVPASPSASEGTGASTSGLSAGDGALTSSARTFSLVGPDGEIQQLTASRVYNYRMEPGAAKPKLLGKTIDAGIAVMSSGPGAGMPAAMPGYGMESGGYGMGMMSGSTAGYDASRTAGSDGAAANDQRSPIKFTFHAFIIDEPESPVNEDDNHPTRATIKVAIPVPPQQLGSEGGIFGMGMGMGGGEMAEMGGVRMAPFPLYGEIDQLPADPKSLLDQTYGHEALKSIAHLIRLDVWIDDARTALREKRNDAKAFAAVETQLKELLSEEYDALLAKQRADAELLRKRLAKLQVDLERRAGAKDRVVEVQLGKLVLEAQGLLDTER